MCEALSPEETIRLLNHYFSHMIDIIERHRGIIVDFFGDALLVFFDPLDGPIVPAVDKCLSCAMGMQHEIHRFNAESIGTGMPELEMGIGIHAGEVVVGNIGSRTRAKYGIVGAPVNLANRIQAVAKAGEIVCSDSVARRAGEVLKAAQSMEVGLKGIKGMVRLHVLAHRDIAFNAQEQTDM
jgi:class 3 adenylate cyclase